MRWLEHRLRSDIGEVPRATVTMSLRPGTAAAARTPTQAPPPPGTDAGAAATARQWRYASAVHAARAVGGP